MNKQMEMDSRFSGKVMLELEINSYMDNGRIYIGLVKAGRESPEHFADLTVNINAPCPDYCGYVDINKYLCIYGGGAGSVGTPAGGRNKE